MGDKIIESDNAKWIMTIMGGVIVAGLATIFTGYIQIISRTASLEAKVEQLRSDLKAVADTQGKSQQDARSDREKTEVLLMKMQLDFGELKAGVADLKSVVLELKRSRDK